jgi:hypothetical protein
MSLIETCINIINNYDEKIKILEIPKTIVKKTSKLEFYDQMNMTNKLLRKYYDQHTGIVIEEKTKSQPPKLDKLPYIKQNNQTALIQIYSINGSFQDMMKLGNKYKNYDTGTKYGNRIVKIVNKVKNAIHNNKNLILDFQYCSGGDINVFIEMFKEIIGTGMIYYFNNTYCHYDGKKLNWNGKEKIFPREKPKNNKRILINVGEQSCSSGEYLPIIIHTSNKNSIIVGNKTGGYMNNTNRIFFEFQNKKFIMNVTTSVCIYDENGKKYKYINPKNKFSENIINKYFYV